MKIIRTFFLPLLMITVSVLTSSAQVLVELHDGSSVTGMALEERNDSLFVRSDGGEVVGIDGDAIRYLGPLEKSSGISTYYPVYGITAGTPGLINFTGGYYTPFLTLRLALLPPLMSMSAVQVDCGYPLVQSANLTLDLYGSYGQSAIGEIDNERERKYIGLGSSIRYYVLFLSAGVRYDLDGKDLGPMAQLGAIMEMTQ